MWRDASGRLTFDLASVEAADYPAACRAVADNFALASDGAPVIGPEQLYWAFRRAEQEVGFDWDIWMGFMVVAKSEAAESLVRDIAAWLSSSQWAGEMQKGKGDIQELNREPDASADRPPMRCKRD